MRFKFENDRRLALASRLLRRYAFVRYYGMTWGSLRFVQAQKGGKPKLEGFEDCFDFNVSHQGDWVILVATDQRGCQVGIDAVCTDSMPSSMTATALVDTFAPQLAPKELDMLRSHPHPIEAFYALWALKESYVKALGIGLYMDLHNVCFRNKADKIELITGQEKRGRTQDVEPWQFQLHWLDNRTMSAVCCSKKNKNNDNTQTTQLIGDSAPTMPHPFVTVTFADLVATAAAAAAATTTTTTAAEAAALKSL
ncbi:4'-phosphopantetheinyl transferase superfamily [Zychaea mexicana]|uniref:4'-phosphopantetheinyl transferase superfamily n=1 Tax=Zychaea mexicana TaxID=64656 RepID=UPI0022FE1D84|nr:4'-phosphopantetheinyl transferase superfamily [Zychaea mexicana]KAI9491317.1 4'-phosphopantetheinyl transferase superfamily [Zychaea mexicana]